MGEKHGRERARVPAITAGVYLVASLTWIWGSDAAGRFVFTSVGDYARFEALKGFGYALLTALLLYVGLAASSRAACRRDRQLHEQAQRDLDARTAELVTANRALESFTYCVAHDLRAPLAHVDGFAKALQEALDKPDPGRARHYTQRIVANVKAMSDMIEGMLHVSRAERAAIRRERVDMTALVGDVVGELAPDPRVAIAIEPLPGAHADRTLLRQVWANLISNAAKYSACAEAPRVRVSAEQQAGEVVYCVQDNGVGFDPAEADRLFNAFQRLSNAQAFAGSGVGLAIVKRIVERHGGRVWAAAEPGRGARFCFSVPYGADRKT